MVGIFQKNSAILEYRIIRNHTYKYQWVFGYHQLNTYREYVKGITFNII